MKTWGHKGPSSNQKQDFKGKEVILHTERMSNSGRENTLCRKEVVWVGKWKSLTVIHESWVGAWHIALDIVLKVASAETHTYQ